MNTVLQLNFVTEGNKTSCFTVGTPADGLTDKQIADAMDAILAQNVLVTASGALQSKKGAQFVTKNVREVTMA